MARAINCNVRTVRRMRQRYRETGRTADCPRSVRPRVATPAHDRYIRTSHLWDRYRMTTRTARVTPGTHNPSISVRLREAGLRACRPVVRQVLNRQQASQPSVQPLSIADSLSTEGGIVRSWCNSGSCCCHSIPVPQVWCSDVPILCRCYTWSATARTIGCPSGLPVALS